MCPQQQIKSKSNAAFGNDVSELSLSNTSRRQSRRSSPGILKRSSTMDESTLSNTLRRSTGSMGSTRRMPVSFDIVEIHEHAMIHDKSRAGPALTIDWAPMNTEVTTVQEFDCNKCHKKNVRAYNPAERASILMKAGYKLEDLCFHELAEDIKKEVQKANRRNKTPKRHMSSPSSISTSTTSTSNTKNKTMYSMVKKAAKKLVVNPSHPSMPLNSCRC
ncbi:expressed unknown protein [Seminavis robusta]|uniref:Uncharacterized protein n=1 Tax=Seminavis robusta TaxID=568900 RepID=A0A9N8DYF5_9STRA|nr:expressed unknown protein [Seminavis robusta]|eukprot:Sro342_g121690.1 n/a (218) ;mRNA; f:24331-24984